MKAIRMMFLINDDLTFEAVIIEDNDSPFPNSVDLIRGIARSVLTGCPISDLPAINDPESYTETQTEILPNSVK
jgi:hypothetical protein